MHSGEGRYAPEYGCIPTAARMTRETPKMSGRIQCSLRRRVVSRSAFLETSLDVLLLDSMVQLLFLLPATMRASQSSNRQCLSLMRSLTETARLFLGRPSGLIHGGRPFA